MRAITITEEELHHLHEQNTRGDAEREPLRGELSVRIAVDQIGVEQLIAKQIHHGLHRLTHSHHRSGQGISRNIAAETPQQRGLAVKWQPILVFSGGHPSQRILGKETLRDQPRWRHGDAQALIAARAGVFHPLVSDDGKRSINPVLAEVC